AFVAQGAPLRRMRRGLIVARGTRIKKMTKDRADGPEGQGPTRNRTARWAARSEERPIRATVLTTYGSTRGHSEHMDHEEPEDQHRDRYSQQPCNHVAHR